MNGGRGISGFMRPGWTLIVVLCLAVFWGVAPAIGAKDRKAKARIRIVSPPANSLIDQKSVYLVGVVEGADAKQVVIQGVRAKTPAGGAPVEGGGFGAMITLSRGENTITVSAAGLKQRIKVYYLPAKELKKGAKVPGNFVRFFEHQKQTPLNCKECHRFKRGKYNFKRIIPARSNCTTKCHADMGKAAHVHGPVGAGVCISCHNPHGSVNELQLARTGPDLCLICHQAKREEFNQEIVHAPVEEGCTDCHDPHQSPMRFQLRGKKGGPVSSLCFQCHEQEIFTQKHQHGPVGSGDCIACHRPHASKNAKLLIAPQKGGQLCFQCHQDKKKSFDSMKFMHDPVAEDCGECHDPHSSKFRFQLHEKGGKLCASCHKKLTPEVYDDIAQAVVKHKPVAEGHCTACHRPHTSNVQPLLKAPMQKLCFGCHTDLGDEVHDSKYLHGPVKTGDCTACHKPHGSKFSRMLVREFPKEFYSDYKEGKYALCFGCHNKEIAKTKRTTTLTNFRDGNYNLHYFHVNRKKGRSCIACHDPHASNQPKHVRSEVPFGSWSYPISFTKTKTGGTCVVGCHAPKSYDREHPKLKHGK